MNESKPVTRFELQVHFEDGRGLVMCDYLTELIDYILDWKDIIDYVRIVPIKISSEIEIPNTKIKKSILK